MTDDAWTPSPLDLSRPNVARIYDYLLGGTSNFAADRRVGGQIFEAMPEVSIGVRAQRALLARVVRYLVQEAGVRQLIDIGSGLPTAGNVHEVAHQVNPATRVAYVDNDPIVLSQARALLTGDEPTIVLDGDLCRPTEIFENADVSALIDLRQPVGLLLCGILHHIRDDEGPERVIDALYAGLPSGSYVFIHHLVDTGDPDAAGAQAALRQGLGRGQFRKLDEVRRFFDGLDLIQPGLVPVPEWRPDAATCPTSASPALRLGYGGVARKP